MPPSPAGWYAHLAPSWRPPGTHLAPTWRPPESSINPLKSDDYNPPISPRLRLRRMPQNRQAPP
eukprot:8084476-Pyramimonas_sp.AAC.1